MDGPSKQTEKDNPAPHAIVGSTAPNFPVRRRLAHPPPIDRGNDPTVLFVTVCVLDRAPILANAEVHAALRRVWPRADHWRVGRYLVMPDHVHLFCTPGLGEPLSVRRWAAYWKRLLALELPAIKGRMQRDCWDTQIRNRRHYDERLQYMRDNPVRATLVQRTEDWPFQGKLTTIRW